MQKQNKTSTRGLGYIVAIAIAAIAIALFSYWYSTYNANSISQRAIADIDKTSRIQTNDVSKLLANKVDSIKNNLVILASANRIEEQNVSLSAHLFARAQELTGQFTDSYFWLDKDGKVLWGTSFSNSSIYQQYVGADRSDRSFYYVPKQTHSFFATNVIQSADNVPRLFLAYPILSQDGSGTFRGVVAASANLKSLGDFIQSQLSSETSNNIALLDTNSTILYWSQDEKLMGLNFFGDKVQSALPNGQRASLDDAIGKTINSRSEGQVTISYNGTSSSLTFAPVSVDGQTFAVLYITASHALATENQSILDSQRNFTLIFIVAIAAVAVGGSAVVARWNKRLTALVSKRTEELERSNASLSQAYEDLQVHDKLQKEFVNVAAHELRTPVQPLLGAAEIIGAQFQNRDRIEITKPEIEMIIRNARRLERLSSDILDLSRIDSGAFKLHKERFSLAFIIANAIKDAKIQSTFDPDKLALVYYPDDIFLDADKEKVTQVVTNLLVNAIKFTKEGTITITSQKESNGNQVRVTIKDTGPGIDPDVKEKLFEKFITKSEKGTGIGLYISKNIIEAHGGSIQGQNNLNGPGASFSFTLPLGEPVEEIKDKQSVTSDVGPLEN